MIGETISITASWKSWGGGGMAWSIKPSYFNSGTLWSCAYSADGKWLAFGRGNSQSDVVLFTAGK